MSSCTKGNYMLRNGHLSWWKDAVKKGILDSVASEAVEEEDLFARKDRGGGILRWASIDGGWRRVVWSTDRSKGAILCVRGLGLWGVGARWNVVFGNYDERSQSLGAAFSEDCEGVKTCCDVAVPLVLFDEEDLQKVVNGHLKVKTFISCYRTPGPQKGSRRGFWRGLWRVLEGF